MGVVELNRILGINLSVPNIETVYDLCKSGDAYYLRVRAKRSGFVTTLEDSNRYAGDDHVFVSGEWEFDDSEPVASRVVRIPRRLGTTLSKDRDLSAFFYFLFCIYFCRTDIFCLLCKFPSEKIDGQED